MHLSTSDKKRKKLSVYIPRIDHMRPKSSVQRCMLIMHPIELTYACVSNTHVLWFQLLKQLYPSRATGASGGTTNIIIQFEMLYLPIYYIITYYRMSYTLARKLSISNIRELSKFLLEIYLPSGFFLPVD